VIDEPLFDYYPYAYVVVRGIQRILSDSRLEQACFTARQDYEQNRGNALWALDVADKYCAVRYATLEHACEALSGVVGVAKSVLGSRGVAVSNGDPTLERTLVLAAGLRRAGFHVLLLVRKDAAHGALLVGIVCGGAESRPLNPEDLCEANNDGNFAMLVMDTHKGIHSSFADFFVKTPIRDGAYYYVDLNEPVCSDESVLSARTFYIWDRTHGIVGTGFFVTRDGLALTALHVVDQVGPLLRVRKRDAVDLNARVLFRNDVDDMALLRVEVGESAGAPLTTLPLCSDPGVPDGGLREVVSAYGYINEPGDFEEGRPYTGRIWYKADVQFQGARQRQKVSVIARVGDSSLLDAKFMKGSSGGPVINAATGTLMGMITGRRPHPGDAVAEAGYAAPIERILGVVSNGRWDVCVEKLAIPLRIDTYSHGPRESST
jgi:hypothetical protein